MEFQIGLSLLPFALVIDASGNHLTEVDLFPEYVLALHWSVPPQSQFSKFFGSESTLPNDP